MLVVAEAVDMLMTAYGAEAGNAALKFLPLGGLYIAGGLAPKNKEAILASVDKAAAYAEQAGVALAAGEEGIGGAWPGFMPAFLDKGRQRELVARIPVKLVLNEDIGQQGAQYTAYTQLVTASIGTSTSNLQLLVIYTLFLDRELWLQAAAVRLVWCREALMR